MTVQECKGGGDGADLVGVGRTMSAGLGRVENWSRMREWVSCSGIDDCGRSQIHDGCSVVAPAEDPSLRCGSGGSSRETVVVVEAVEVSSGLGEWTWGRWSSGPDQRGRYSK